MKKETTQRETVKAGCVCPYQAKRGNKGVLCKDWKVEPAACKKCAWSGDGRIRAKRLKKWEEKHELSAGGDRRRDMRRRADHGTAGSGGR